MENISSRFAFPMGMKENGTQSQYMQTVPLKTYEKCFEKRERQILTPVKVRVPSDKTFFEAVALWDTGSTMSGISYVLADTMGLSPENYGPVDTASGTSKTVDYYVAIHLSEELHFDCARVMGFHNAPNFDVSIGMDIISGGNLAILNNGGKTTLLFEFPALF